MKRYSFKKIISLTIGLCLSSFNYSCTNPLIKTTEIKAKQTNSNLIKVSDHGAELDFNVNLNNFSTKANTDGTAAKIEANINKYLVYLIANTNSAGYPSGGDPLTDKVAGPFTITASGMSNIRLSGVPASPTSPNKYYYIALQAQDSSNIDLIKPNNGGTNWGGTSAGQPIAVSSGAGVFINSSLQVSSSAALSTTVNLKDSIGVKLETSLTIVPGGTATQTASVVNIIDTTVNTSGLSMPCGVVASGTYLYIADTNNNSIKKVSTSGGTVTTLATGLGQPRGLAVSGTDLYIADTNNNAIKKVSTSGGTVTTLPISGLNHPYAIAVSDTDLYIADTNNNAIKKVSTSGGTTTTIVTGLLLPQSIAVSGTDLYIADTNNNAIKKTNISGGIVHTLVSSGLLGPRGITVSGTNIYIADTSNNEIKKVSTSGGTVTTLATGLNQPCGTSIDEDTGILYFADSVSGQIRALK